MRKLFAFVVVFLVLASYAGTAQARDVINSSGTQEEVSAGWFFETDEGGFVSGNAYGANVKGGEMYLEFFEVTGTPIVCDDGTDGSRVEIVSGYGPATVEIDKRYRSGTASAVLDLFVETFDECFFFPENGGGGTIIEDVPVSLSATATGDLRRSTSSSGFHIPSEENEHSRFDSRFREGTGVVNWGENQRIADFAQIGKVSSRFHLNN